MLQDYDYRTMSIVFNRSQLGCDEGDSYDCHGNVFVKSTINLNEY